MSPLDRISIRGAREHNLKGIDLEIPRDQLVVITGLSGSGKSSLAFDTIYAEGQRRYVESLSAYARQFLGQMDKPDVDHIEGLSPAVSIDQKTTSRNPRSTVGTVTEIYDYLRLLFARVGIPHCPMCGRRIEKQTRRADRRRDPGAAAMAQVPGARAGREGSQGRVRQALRGTQARGLHARARRRRGARHSTRRSSSTRSSSTRSRSSSTASLMKDGVRTRLAESVEMALKLAAGHAHASHVVDGEELDFSQALACPEHGISMDELAPRDFSFNAPYGACPECAGLGSKLEVDPDLVVPDPDAHARRGRDQAVLGQPQLLPAACRGRGEAPRRSISTRRGTSCPKKAQEALLNGLGDKRIRLDYVTRDGRETFWFTKYEGALALVMRRYDESESEQVKDKLQEYMALIPCKTCRGARLKPEILAVTIGGKNINEVTMLSGQGLARILRGARTHRARAVRSASASSRRSSSGCASWWTSGSTTSRSSAHAATLSGGEAQRIRLATQIGSGLVGVLYILDEPSIGLHQRDNARLIDTLERLRDLGNTVIVVEHDEETIRAADYVVDMGPGAGEHGGEIVCQGTPEDMLACRGLAHRRVPRRRR